MGAAYDAMCENDGLESRLRSRNRQIREQKKLITELTEGIVKYFDGDRNYSIEEMNSFWNKAKAIVDKKNKNNGKRKI